ncbi:hypothetical protein [Nonomuraea sp. SBT364]|uniref:hypothetical protein n=1 Tax=Nonomuraea sp. SBT364 TaxID=1580530 RepID=UPI00066A33B0|nr:hypothetical protein [Nonomuraea sp. SBT364]
MESDSARIALEGVAEVRARVADRIVSPWWYHYGFAAAILLAYVSISFRFASYGVPFLTIAAVGLTVALKRTTGIEPRAPRATRAVVAWSLVALALTVVAMALEWGGGVKGAVAVAGVAVAAIAVVAGHRTDRALRRELRDGHDPAGL